VGVGCLWWVWGSGGLGRCGVGGVMVWVFFFFSSRRRHTRSYGDWSSDVCSSDLWASWLSLSLLLGCLDSFAPAGAVEFTPPATRSEERRVGKECRSRWSPYP